jgi:hypothetical protein
LNENILLAGIEPTATTTTATTTTTTTRANTHHIIHYYHCDGYHSTAVTNAE